MKKPFLANFEVSLKNNIQGSTVTCTIEDSDPDMIICEHTMTRSSIESTDPDFFICGFTQRTRSSEDSDTDESII